MILHWIRTTQLTHWFERYQQALNSEDVLLISDKATADIPIQAPCSNTIYYLAEDANAPQGHDYLQPLSDSEWVALVTSCDKQVVW